jgi:hypothetical protein
MAQETEGAAIDVRKLQQSLTWQRFVDIEALGFGRY